MAPEIRGGVGWTPLTSFAMLIMTTAGRQVTTADCLMRFGCLDFDLLDASRYLEFFENTSTLTLAQAGTYEGPAGIAEYVKFSSSDSPYVARRIFINEEVALLDIQNGGMCEFLYAGLSSYEMNATTAAAVTFNVTVMVKIFYDVHRAKIPTIYVYYDAEFLTYFFTDVLGGSTTRDYVRWVLEGPCDTSSSDFERRWAELPVVQGQDAAFDGNSQSCRALHAVFAATNPVGHCPHVTFQPDEDPDGEIKCIASSHLQPSAFFNDSDIEWFDAFKDAACVPPDGYSTQTSWCSRDDDSSRRHGRSLTDVEIILSFLVVALFLCFVAAMGRKPTTRRSPEAKTPPPPPSLAAVTSSRPSLILELSILDDDDEVAAVWAEEWVDEHETKMERFDSFFRATKGIDLEWRHVDVVPRREGRRILDDAHGRARRGHLQCRNQF